MDTLDLLRRVRFDKAFMFAYSMRERTHAHRSLSDDVDEPTKQRRLREVIDLFNEGAREANQEQVDRALGLSSTLALSRSCHLSYRAPTIKPTGKMRA